MDLNNGLHNVPATIEPGQSSLASPLFNNNNNNIVQLEALSARGHSILIIFDLLQFTTSLNFFDGSCFNLLPFKKSFCMEVYLGNENSTF